MFSSTILDVIVGLSFVFLVVSLVTSALTEALASALKLRSKTLLAAIQALVNDTDGTGLAKALYNSALISPRDSGDKLSTATMTKKLLPSYINPEQFADAMIELNGLIGKAPMEIKQDIQSNAMLSDQTKRLLTGMVDRAQSNVDALRDELSGWFDGAMDRISGAYKRWTQLVAFLIALTVAILLNIDTIAVAHALWVQPMVTKSIDGQRFNDATDAYTKLEALNLPIGWDLILHPTVQNPHGRIWTGLTILIGWLITAAASLLGAPFWYDTLQIFVRIKGAGPSPAEKKTGSGAAA